MADRSIADGDLAEVDPAGGGGTGGGVAAAAPSPDGRRARRERGRLAVIDAMVDLVRSGHSPPTAQEIAERAGVSMSSLFRYFPTLEQLRAETTRRFFERYDRLFELPEVGEGPFEDRVDRYVTARLDLHETVAPVSRFVRIRLAEHPELAATVSGVRTRLAEQTDRHFAPELDRLDGAARDELVALLTTLTSFEAWDLLRQAQGQRREQTGRAWAFAVRSLIEAAVRS